MDERDYKAMNGIKDGSYVVVIGKDAPANVLYLQEIAKLIQHRIRCQDSKTDADVDKLHKMAMDALTICGC
tara:strand:- start:2025 stop:2237 length:213 start_codon:yes stop_codon:yes gene_type:complete